MKKIVLATVLLLGSASAFAVTAQSGVYVGALGGWSFADSPSSNANQMNSTSNSKQNYTFGGTLGYSYAINQNFSAGIEGSYVNFGKNTYDNASGATGTNVNISNSGWQIMAVGNYLMSNGFNAFAKAGTIHEKTDVSASNSYFTANGLVDSNAWEPALAVGLGYMPMQNLNITLQYEYTFGDDWNNDNLSNTPKPMIQNAVTLGVTYLFPM